MFNSDDARYNIGLTLYRVQNKLVLNLIFDDNVIFESYVNTL